MKFPHLMRDFNIFLIIWCKNLSRFKPDLDTNGFGHR